MQFPRLLLPRVAVWRGPHDLRIGGKDGHLVLEGVPTLMEDAVHLLDGRHSMDDLSRVCGQEWASWLVDALGSHGVLSEGVEESHPLCVRVVGEGAVAEAVAALVPPVMRRRCPQNAETVSIVAAPTLEVDRVTVEALGRRDPYLLVGASSHSASVGPFVVPGLTSCLTCVDLTRRSYDRTWPVQVFQLSRMETEPDPVMSAWAAATAICHVRAYSRGEVPESVSTTIELSSVDGRLTYTRWPVHPDCPCQSQ